MRSWFSRRRVVTPRRRLLLEPLEERIVFDAAGDGGGNDQTDDNADAGQSQDSGSNPATAEGADSSSAAEADAGADPLVTIFEQDLNVILISNALDQIDQITAAAGDDTQVIVYDAAADSLDEVIDQLVDEVTATGLQIGHLAWFTHGDPGVLKVGDYLVFSAQTILSNPESWQSLGSLMAEDAQIDLYGCDIASGSEGVDLVNALAETTDAAVWASDDTTGSGESADWDLEVGTGESSLPALVDTSILEEYSIVLDNSDMTNPGFETGDITGWTAENDYAVVSADTGGNYGGIDVGSSPYASDSDYMLRLDSSNTGTGDLDEPSGIRQSFTYTSDDDLVFAYNFVTNDGDPYSNYDEFGYRVTVNGSEVVYYQINSGDVLPDQWQLLRSSGWQEVTIDLSAYASIGDTIVLEIWAGNTVDNQYDSWAFIDMPEVYDPYDLPTAEPGSVTVQMNESITFQVIGYDPDLHDVSVVSFDILDGYEPTHGTLVAEDEFGVVTSVQYDAENGYYYQTYTYTPDADYWGADAFLFTFSTPSGSWDGFVTGTGVEIGASGEYYDTYDLALVDIDQDGNMDLVTANANLSGYNYQDNMYYMSDLSGFFLNGVSMEDLTGSWSDDSISIAVGDLNGDGYQDVVVRTANSVGEVYLWDNDAGGFQPVTSLSGSSGGSDGSVDLADFDGDGDLDVVVGCSTGDDRIYWNNGDGTFASSYTSLPSTNGTTSVVKTGDFNGDGYIDILVGKSSNNYAAIHYNDGYGGFSSTHTETIYVRYVQCADVGDVDGDGDLDIVLGTLSGWWNRNYNYFVENNGNDGDGHVNWSTATLPNDRNDTEGIAFADVDGDGDLDVIVADENARVRLYLFNDASGTYSTGINISSTNLDAQGLSVGDVDGDGDIDLVVALENGNNLYFENNGWESGSTSMTHGKPALVTIHVEAIYNWSFEKEGDHYGGWSFSETYANDPELPAGVLAEYGTFGIIENQEGGYTINFGDVVYDYLDDNDQMQFSFHTLSWVPGMPGITIDGSETAHTAVILSGLDQKDASLFQVVDIEQDVYLDGLVLEWDMSYWNANPSQLDGSEFGENQFVAVYLYDVSSGTPVQVYVTTNGQDEAVVGSMEHYAVEFASDSDLVQSINDGDVQLMVEIRVCGIEWYLDVAVDDFTLIPSRHYPAFQVNPVASADDALNTGADGIFGASASVSEYSLAEFPAGASPTASAFSFDLFSSVPEIPLATFDDSELLEGFQASPLSFRDSGEPWMPNGFFSPEESSLSTPYRGSPPDGTSGIGQILGAREQPSTDNADMPGTQGGAGATDEDTVSVPWLFADAADQDQAPPEDPSTGAGIAAGDPDSDGGAEDPVLEGSLPYDAVKGIVFNMEDIDAWQVIHAVPPTLASSNPNSLASALNSRPDGSFAVRIESLRMSDLFA